MHSKFKSMKQSNLKYIAISLLFCAVSVPRLQAQIITTIAGNGLYGDTTGAVPATSAKLGDLDGVAVDTTGNVYFTDQGHNVIKKINTTGILTTFAGNGSGTHSGDGGQATAAGLGGPDAIAIDSHGNIYITDNALCIRKINTSGIITTVAGLPFTPGYSGDGGPATAAKFNFITGIAIDNSDNIYIADYYNHAIRKVSGGIVTTFAGTPLVSGHSGDGNIATAAKITYPLAVATDAAGNVFIEDGVNYIYIRKVNTSGIISTIAGCGLGGYSGDGGQATTARFSIIHGIAIDTHGNIFVSDGGNTVVRVINTLGYVFTYAGVNPFGGYTGDGGPANFAHIDDPHGIALDANADLYIADKGNLRIRKVTASTAVPVVNQNQPISISPNPATDIIHINDPTKVTIKLYNTLGTLVAQAANTDQISVSALPPGIYFIRLFGSNNELVYQGKILKE